jgi:hypothetical protein
VSRGRLSGSNMKRAYDPALRGCPSPPGPTSIRRGPPPSGGCGRRGGARTGRLLVGRQLRRRSPPLPRGRATNAPDRDVRHRRFLTKTQHRMRGCDVEIKEVRQLPANELAGMMLASIGGLRLRKKSGHDGQVDSHPCSNVSSCDGVSRARETTADTIKPISSRSV